MYRTAITKEWHGNEVKIQAEAVQEKSAYEIGLVIEGQAKALAPVRYGYLSASINTRTTDKSSGLGNPVNPTGSPPKGFRLLGRFLNLLGFKKKVYAIVGTAVEYGPYVEFGTIRSGAQPFLRPALDLAEGKALTIVENNGRFEFKEYLS